MSQQNEKAKEIKKPLFTGRDKKKEEPREKKSLGREIFEWIMVFVVAGALALTVRTLIFEPVYINGELTEQPFPLRNNTLKDYYIDKIPEGQYVLFGDNRGNSRDTRDVGLIPRSMIKGHVRAVVFPFSKFQIMEY